MVESIDLLNRYCRSLRCRQAAAELVTSLAPLCLPGPEELWKTIIHGHKVWPALRERPANKRIDLYFDDRFPEVSLFELFPLSSSEKRHCVGYVNNSRYDLDIALTVAVVALYVGVQHLRARYSYDLASWKKHLKARLKLQRGKHRAFGLEFCRPITCQCVLLLRWQYNSSTV